MRRLDRFLVISLSLIALSVAGLAACSTPAATPAPSASMPSNAGVVVQVGGLSGTRDDFQREYERIKESLIASSQAPSFDETQPGGEEVRAKISAQAIQQLINKLLVRWEAEQKGIQLSPAEIEQEIALLRLIYGSHASFQWALQRSYGGSEEELRRELADRLLLEQVLVAYAPQRFQAGEQELQDYFAQRSTDFDRPARLRLWQITATPSQLARTNVPLSLAAQSLEEQGSARDLGYLPRQEINTQALQGLPGSWQLISQTPTQITWLKRGEEVPARSFTYQEMAPLVWRTYYSEAINQLIPELFASLQERYPALVVQTP